MEIIKEKNIKNPIENQYEIKDYWDIWNAGMNGDPEALEWFSEKSKYKEYLDLDKMAKPLSNTDITLIPGLDAYLKPLTDFRKVYPEEVTDLFVVDLVGREFGRNGYENTYDIYEDESLELGNWIVDKETIGFEYDNTQISEDNQLEIGTRVEKQDDINTYRITFYIDSNMWYNNDTQITEFAEDDVYPNSKGFSMPQFTTFSSTLHFRFGYHTTFSPTQNIMYFFDLTQTLSNDKPFAGPTGHYYFSEDING